MIKTETVVTQTQTKETYYCDLCAKKIEKNENGYHQPVINKDILDSIAATQVFGYTQIYCRPEFAKAKDEIYVFGNPSREENKEVWDRIKDTYPMYQVDCCYQCFQSKLIPFIESQKIKPTV